MIRHLFERKATHEAELLAEAQALVDDGLDLDFVLGLFPDDAEWLEPMLAVSIGIEDAFDSEPASYYFEASLKAQFLGAARQPRPIVPVVVAAPVASPFRTAVATMSVGAIAAALGVLALGFISAEDSAPGDWNYAFKLANERFEYSTSRGNSRIDVQISHIQNRVAEFQTLSERGQVSHSEIERIQREIDEFARANSGKNLDSLDRARFEGSAKAAAAILSDVATKQPELREPAASAAAAIGDSVTVLAPPTLTPTATATASPEASPTPEETSTPPATPSPTPVESATPTPEATGTATPEPSVTSTAQPSEEATATVTPTTAP